MPLASRAGEGTSTGMRARINGDIGLFTAFVANKSHEPQTPNAVR